jgi:hypothetical protein
VSAQKYRKRPHVIEVMQWTGDNINAIWDWAGADGIYGPTERNPDQLILTTIHGEQAIAHVGDWVLPEPQPGRFYPCQAGVFETLYEPMED